MADVIGVHPVPRNETAVAALQNPVEGGLRVDEDGVMLFGEAAAGGTEISLQPGIYIVKVNNGAKVIRKKVLVK